MINSEANETANQGVFYAKAINDFFFAIIKSKDKQFLTLCCKLLNSLIGIIRNKNSSEEVIDFYTKKIGIGRRATN